MTHAVVWIDHKEARIFHVHSDHPTGGEIVARARSYFQASDRMG